MHKILIFTFLILLVGCSLQDKEKIGSISTQYSDKNIEDILGYMEINKEIDPREYHVMHDLLTKVETPCMGKGFREYRECFISNLEQGERNLKIDQKSRDQLSSLKRSIRDEIVYFEYYKELDDAPLLEYSNNENIGCTIVSYTLLPEDDHSFPVVLSYSDSLKKGDALSLVGFSSQKNYTGSTSLFNHDNPCVYHTFGPDIGNIFSAFQTENRTYLFIKSGDGGGSGEFAYTIFVNEKGSHFFQPIMASPGTNGLPPSYIVGYNQNTKQLAVEKISILDQNKNQPFVYKVYLEDERRGIVSAIRKLLGSSFE